MIKIVIIEDNKYMREGWKTFIDFEPDMEVAGAFESCEAAIEFQDFSDVQLIIMDIELPGITGIEGVRIIKKSYPDMLCIMATVFDDNQHVFDALRAGAVGYIMKKTSPVDFIAAIRTALDGGSPITPNIARKVISIYQEQEEVISEEEALNEKEKQILEHLAMGKSYAEIGGDIFLSVDGVRYHIRKIYEKLQVHSRSEAVAEALSRKLIDSPARDTKKKSKLLQKLHVYAVTIVVFGTILQTVIGYILQ
ncbi:MAG: response regulator transcription factor [Balneolales bacterium]|nr:response regulator transcription factor [Balneolales bacterium]